MPKKTSLCRINPRLNIIFLWCKNMSIKCRIGIRNKHMILYFCGNKILNLIGEIYILATSINRSFFIIIL